jgi:hypothetical protein
VHVALVGVGWVVGHGTSARSFPDPRFGLPPGVSDGTRTRDVLDHNQVLYQLSYTHHANGPKACSVDHIAQREVYRAPPWRA